MKSELIYIVEDNKMIAELIKYKLSKKYKVQVFKSAKTFLKAMHSNVSAILMDFNLEEEVSGIELCDVVNNQYKVPIIAISSQQKLSVVLNFVKNGVVDYIDKTEYDFLNKIENCLEAIFHHKTQINNQKLLLNSKKNLYLYAFLVIIFFTVILSFNS